MKKQNHDLSIVQTSAIQRYLELYKQDHVEDDKTPPQIRLDKSPFEKQRNMNAPRGSANLQAQVSQDMFDDFMRFALQYNEEHNNPPKIKKGGELQHNKANPLKHIINEFLNTHAFEKQYFEDLHMIMAFNNPFEHDQRKCELIGFVQHPEKFTKHDPFRVSNQRKHKTRVAYTLDEFDETTFDMLNLSTFNHEVLFNINPSLYGNFEDVKKRLQDLYDLDFDNAFIVMFNLNNYFDTLRDGVYTSKTSKDKHEGVVVFVEPNYKIDRVIIRIKWGYNDGILDYEFIFEDVGFFNLTLSNDLPQDVYDEYWAISSGLMQTDIAKLEIDLKNKKESIETHKNIIARDKRDIERIERKLKKLKQ